MTPPTGAPTPADDPRTHWNTVPSPRERRSKRHILLGIAFAAFVLRALLVLVVHPTCPGHDDLFGRGDVLEHEQLVAHVQSVDDDRLGAPDATAARASSESCFSVRGDPLATVVQATMIAEGHGMSSPVLFILTGREVPGAGRPPAWTMTIAALDVAGLRTPTDARLAAAVLGAAAVLLIGHVAWQLAGRAAGIAAAGIAAANPSLFINDWRLLNDGPYALVVAIVLWCSYRLWARPTMGRAAVLGAVIALGFYTRAEALLLVVLLIPPLVGWLPNLERGRRWQLGAVAGAVALALVVPYGWWNLQRFHHPQPTIGTGVALLNGSCDRAWYGDRIGMVEFSCFDDAAERIYFDVTVDPDADESDVDRDHGERARAYIKANAQRLPLVMAARIGRVYGVFQPAATTRFDVDIEQRGRVEPWLALGVYYLLVPVAVGGFVHLRRRRIPTSPFVALAASVTITVALTHGLPRYRVPVDVALCLLGGIGVAALLRWYRCQRSDGADGLAALAAGAREAAGRDWRRATQRVGRSSPSVRLAAITGTLGLLVLLVWSAGATPREPVLPADDAPVAVDETTCAVLVNQVPSLRSLLDQRDAPTLVGASGLIASFDAIARRATMPDVVADAEAVRAVLQVANDNGTGIDAALTSMGGEAADEFERALDRLLRWSVESCSR